MSEVYANDGHLAWVDDDLANWVCACGNTEVILGPDEFTECDGCGRRYKLEQVTRVIEDTSP